MRRLEAQMSAKEEHDLTELFASSNEIKSTSERPTDSVDFDIIEIERVRPCCMRAIEMQENVPKINDYKIAIQHNIRKNPPAPIGSEWKEKFRFLPKKTSIENFKIELPDCAIFNSCAFSPIEQKFSFTSDYIHHSP